MSRGHKARLGAAVWGLVAFAGPASARQSPSTPMAVDAATASASATGASAKLQPRGERQLGQVARPTVKKKAEAAAQAKREGRVSMAIPERLRATLERQIEDRIERDTAATKALRREAMGLLVKFVAETPKT